MHIGKFSLALVALTAAILPAVSQASPEKIALNACASAFANSIAAPGASVPTFKLNYGNGQFGSLLADNSEYTFYLKANSSKTGQPLARATCSTDSRGAVIALTATPL